MNEKIGITESNKVLNNVSGYKLKIIQKTRDGWKMFISRDFERYHADLIIDILPSLKEEPQIAINQETGGFLIVKSPQKNPHNEIPEAESIKEIRILITNGFKVEIRPDKAFHIIPCIKK